MRFENSWRSSPGNPNISAPSCDCFFTVMWFCCNLRRYSCRTSSRILPGSSRSGEAASRTKPSACCAMESSLPISCSASRRYSSRPAASRRARYTRLISASSGFLISCAIAAVNLPAVARRSLRRRASSVRFCWLMSRAIADAPTSSPFSL